jgi:hypothetical protein
MVTAEGRKILSDCLSRKNLGRRLCADHERAEEETTGAIGKRGMRRVIPALRT